MSVCLENNNVLASQVGTASTSQNPDQSTIENVITTISSSSNSVSSIEGSDPQQQVLPAKSVTKLLVSNHQNSVGGSVAPVLQKINPVITVLNSAGGPLTVLKTICVTSGVSSAPHFSLVNNQPLTVSNAVGKTPTITLLNAPVTVVKVPPLTQSDKSLDASNSSVNTQNIPTIIENRAHNVFVKNTCLDPSLTEVPQSHKFLTANSFPQSNVLPTVAPVSGKTVNGQRNKLKIISTVAVPSTSNTQPPNFVLNKTNAQQQRLVPRQKVLGTNGNQTKYISKLPNNTQKSSHYNLKQVSDKTAVQQSRIMYPTHKSQIKTIPPVNNYIPKVQGIKTITPLQPKSIPGQVQRTGSGLRTIPPQRPPKLPNKLNYIGKHAVQAQKVKQSGGLNRFNKNVKQSSIPPYNNYMQPVHTNKQLAFNQALTAEILETLSNKSTPTTSYSSKNYEILPNRFDGPVYTEQKIHEPVKLEDKSKSGLDALSLICQAVLLDHNYNATLPPDSPNRSTAITTAPSQINGISGNSMLLYSPGASNKTKYPQERKRTLSCSNPVSSNSSTSNLSSIIPSNSTSLINMQEDDAASDISDCSDRKHDTEGEETDTAPEAEAVANEESYDHYGDYVTRCICGYLHDDGYMVECDQCKVWQHVQCVLKNKQVPDEYLCEKCNPLKLVDLHKAKLIQQQWLRERQQLPEMKSFKKENKLKEPFKQKDIVTDTDSSDAENPRHNNNTVGSKARTSHAHRKKSEKQMGRQKKDIKESNSPRKTFKKRERKLVRRKNKLQVKNTEEETQDTFSATTQLPQLRQWIDNYEEAVTNHYSPELRARISNIRVNGAHISDTSTPFDPSVNKCQVHAQLLTDLKYLVATVNIPPNTPVIELRGKYMLSTQHRNAGGNLTTRQHAQRPGPFLFFYRLHKDNTEVCVDTRTYGNNARFVRRSCKPNAELRHCIEKGVLHLYIVTLSSIDKNAELTIKHESHDLAVVGTTHIACYCGKLDECNLNKTVKKNGDNSSETQRKRRGRRTTSASVNSEPETPPVKVIEEPLSNVPPPPPLLPLSPSSIKIEPESEKVDVKIEVKKEDILENKEHIQITEIKNELIEIKEERPDTPIDIKDPPSTSEISDVKEQEVKEEREYRKSVSGLSTRRTSQHKLEKDKDEENQVIPKVLTSKQEKIKNKKLSREERKLEAILRAIEQMEKADQRKQEHKQTKHVQRRESEPSPHSKDDEKPSEPKQKRRRRKGRSRTISTHSVRRDRLNSGDSYFTSGDENMLSPNDGIQAKKPEESADDSISEKQEGLLLALAENDDLSKGEKSPVRETDSNSNSAHSSPETPLSLACSLVQAAVEPLESGFKFPKTKKVLMNEWLNKTPDSLPPISSPLSPHINNTELDTSAGFYTPTKNMPSVGNNIINETGPRKRWLRQAISEDKCDSPQESPPLSNSVAPPKKRRLPRESISNDNTPPSTPTSLPASNTYEETVQQEGCVEIIYSGAECDDNHIEVLESDAVLKERAAEMKQEFSQCIVPPSISEVAQRPDTLTFGCLMDPRLRNHHPIFTNSEHLVGTVEKTLSILGFEDRKPETITPTKRKLSITEYRQRKKLNNNEIHDKSDEICISDDLVNDENNSSESLKMSCRQRLNSTSSSSSMSSDDELATIPELSSKVPSFNSEPTELERQRELQSLRLKKAFGLSIDVESRKPALDVEAILNCDLPTIHTIKPNISLGSPSFLTSGSCEPTDLIKSTCTSPLVHSLVSQSASPNSSSVDLKEILKEDCDSVVPISYAENLPSKEEEIPSADKEIVEENNALVLPKEPKTENMDIGADKDENTEMVENGIKPHLFYTPDEEEEEIRGKSFSDIESINYVPPFNNPIYPSTNYTSVIDEDARYEGRNPSPPPHLESVDTET